MPKWIWNNDDLRVARLALLFYNGKSKVIGGRLAQRLERLVHTEEAGGSNPPSPTRGLAPDALAPNLGADHRAEVAKRQTRCVQGAVSLWTCGFKSLPRHQPFPERVPARPHQKPAGKARKQGKVPGLCACSSVDRALPCGGRGRGFESRQARHFFSNRWRIFLM